MKETTQATMGHTRVVRVEAPAWLDARGICALLRGASEAFASGAKTIVIDFVQVRGLDPTGIRGLVTIKNAAPAGTAVVLAQMNRSIQAIARFTLLHHIFDTYASFDAAATALDAKAR